MAIPSLYWFRACYKKCLQNEHSARTWWILLLGAIDPSSVVIPRTIIIIIIIMIPPRPSSSLSAALHQCYAQRQTDYNQFSSSQSTRTMCRGFQYWMVPTLGKGHPSTRRKIRGDTCANLFLTFLRLQQWEEAMDVHNM